MQQELPAAIGVVVKRASLFVGMDIGVNQPGFFSIYVDISLVDADLMVAYRLDLGALKDKARLISVENMIVKKSLFILGDCLAAHGLILTQIGFQAFSQSITIRVP